MDTFKKPVAVGERNEYENKADLAFLRDRPTAGHLALTHPEHKNPINEKIQSVSELPRKSPEKKGNS